MSLPPSIAPVDVIPRETTPFAARASFSSFPRRRVGAAFIPSSTRRFGGLSATMATATARRLVPTGRPRTSTFAPVVRDDDSVSPLSRARESPTSVNRRIRRGLSRRCSSAQSSSVYPSLSRRDAPAGARTRTSGGEWCSHASARSVAGVRATRLDAIPQRRAGAELSASKKGLGPTRAHCLPIRKTVCICIRKVGVSPNRHTIRGE